MRKSEAVEKYVKMVRTCMRAGTATRISSESFLVRCGDGQADRQG